MMDVLLSIERETRGYSYNSRFPYEQLQRSLNCPVARVDKSSSPAELSGGAQLMVRRAVTVSHAVTVTRSAR